MPYADDCRIIDLNNEAQTPANDDYVYMDGQINGSRKIKADKLVNVQPDWNQADNTKQDYIKNKPNLADVATSGSYNDLNDTPTIPQDAIPLICSDAYDDLVFPVAKGDYCINNNKLYKANVAISTEEAFDPLKWDKTTCAAEFIATNSSLAQYIKRKTVTIPNADIPSGAYLTNILTPDTGYEYLCYTSIASVGWVLTFPIYIDEASKRIWYSGTLTSNQSIKVEFLEIKTLS